MFSYPVGGQVFPNSSDPFLALCRDSVDSFGAFWKGRRSQEDLLETFSRISGSEGPETPVNGGSNRNTCIAHLQVDISKKPCRHITAFPRSDLGVFRMGGGRPQNQHRTATWVHTNAT